MSHVGFFHDFPFTPFQFSLIHNFLLCGIENIKYIGNKHLFIIYRTESIMSTVYIHKTDTPLKLSAKQQTLSWHVIIRTVFRNKWQVPDWIWRTFYVTVCGFHFLHLGIYFSFLFLYFHFMKYVSLVNYCNLCNASPSYTLFIPEGTYTLSACVPGTLYFMYCSLLMKMCIN